MPVLESDVKRVEWTDHNVLSAKNSLYWRILQLVNVSFTE